MAEKARKEDERRRDERRKMETKEKKTNQLDSNSGASKLESSTTTTTTTTTTVKPKNVDKIKIKKEDVIKKDKPKEKKLKEELPPYVDAQAVQHLLDRPKVAHAQNHQIAHNEPVIIVACYSSVCFFFLSNFSGSRFVMKVLTEKIVRCISPWLSLAWRF